jgi:uncharacterized FlaG/YvyC family protein
MEPIKPIEGNVKDAQGQGSMMTEVLRENYWKQRSQQDVQTVKASEDSREIPDEKYKNSAKEHQPQMRHTFAEFEINQDTHEVFVRILDANSGELIRTIPADKLAEEIAKGNLHPNQLRHRGVLV